MTIASDLGVRPEVAVLRFETNLAGHGCPHCKLGKPPGCDKCDHLGTATAWYRHLLMVGTVSTS